MFCDDIRQEVAGKYSIMGVYQADLVAPSSATLPIVLPKLCILIMYFEKPNIHKEDLNVMIYLSHFDEPIFTQTIRRDDIRWVPFQGDRSIDTDVDPVIAITIPVTFSPFVMEKECFIRVRGKLGDETIKLGTLYLRVAKEP
jgi:hypothetical protein